MTRSKRLKPIVEFKDQKQKQCLQDMASSKQRWDNHKTQLENLYQYQKEYHQQQSVKEQAPLSVMQLVEVRRFIDQLENTIKQQNLIVQQAEREYQMKLQYWVRVKNDVRAVEHLVENIEQQEIKNTEKQEQKLSDEFGLRKK